MMDFASYTSAPRPQKRKTYGKKSTGSSYTFSQYADSPQKPKTTPSTWSPEPSPPPAKVVSPASKPATGKLKRPSPKQSQSVDEFDVPLSDDEHISSPRPQKRLKSPTVQIIPHRRVVPVIEPCVLPAASNSGSENNGQSKRKGTVDAAEIQLLHENAMARKKVQAAQAPVQTMKARPGDAIARVAAAKPASRVVKRRSPPAARAVIVPSVATGTQVRHLPKARSVATKSALVNISSPARLEDMMREACRNVDEIITDRSTPTIMNRLDSSSSPRTPPRSSQSPASFASLARSGCATPRQKELWNKLLGDNDGVESPSKLAVNALRIAGASKKLATITLPRSLSDTGPPAQAKRGRLIDTLAEIRTTAASEETDEDESMADDSSVLESFLEESSIASEDQQKETGAVAASLSQAASRVTYGQVRSYMEDSGLEAELMLESPIVPIRPASETTYGSQMHNAQSTAMSPDSDDEDMADSQGPIKSVHELRAKGESQRFTDDFENLLEDIQYRNSARWSRQRTGVMELCEKLTDKKFIGRMLDAGLDQRLLKACSDVPDPIFNFATAAAIALVGRAEAPLSVLRHVQQSQCFDMLFALLPLDSDLSIIAKDRKSNMSKMAQVSLTEFCDKLRQTSLWPEPKPAKLTPQLMALNALETTTGRMRQLGHVEEILDEQKTSDLLQVLERRVSDQKTPKDQSAHALEMALSTLEAGSVIPGRIQTAWTPKRMNRLTKILPNLLGAGMPNAASLTPLALRLLLNLTNGKASASSTFADARLVRILASSINDYFGGRQGQDIVTDEEEASIDDRLILSLGAMINLAEFSDAARTPLIGEGRHLLDDLVDTFLGNREKAAEADSLARTASNVAYGYLAVLLGNLCENEAVRRAVAAKLPEGNLGPLIDAIEEFVAYNKVADRSAFDGTEGNEVWRVFTERLANVAEKLKSL